MLTFQEYFAIGVAVMGTVGWLLTLFDRKTNYLAGQITSLLIFFPMFYMLLVAKRIELGISPYVNVSTVFQFFQDLPVIVTNLLFLVMVIAICVSDLKGKSRGIGYLSVGSLICLGMPWCISDLPVLGATSLSATILLAEGGFTYRREKRKEEMENMCLSLIREKGQVTLEDVMMGLRLPLVEAEDILYDLWDRGLLEKREKGARTIYSIALREGD